MRLYTFTNFYLSGIQQGIQSAHCAVELFNKYHCYVNDNARFPLKEWAQNHKTMIVLSGGDSKSLNNIIEFFSSPTNKFAWAFFREDQQSLNSATTCVGIVLPEYIYEVSSQVSKDHIDTSLTFPQLTNYINRRYACCLNEYEVQLVLLLSSSRLA